MILDYGGWLGTNNPRAKTMIYKHRSFSCCASMEYYESVSLFFFRFFPLFSLLLPLFRSLSFSRRRIKISTKLELDETRRLWNRATFLNRDKRNISDFFF